MNRQLLLFVLFLFVAFSANGMAANLKGTVTDSTGAAIPAQVLIRWDPIGIKGVPENEGLKEDEDKVLTASDSGHFSIELPPGVYDVFVSFKGFYPHCEKISLKRNQVREYKVHLKLSAMETVHLD